MISREGERFGTSAVMDASNDSCFLTLLASLLTRLAFCFVKKENKVLSNLEHCDSHLLISC